jgi:DNA-binding FadR family transcriptional regulator
MVAGQLRELIVSGRLASGDELPRQEDLLAQFQVGSDTLRAALRMLESEGLVTVRRGQRGGAVVHRPEPEHAARAIGIVLQALDTTLDDLALALHHLEPTCAVLCAQRPDRVEVVVPELERLNVEAQAVLDEPMRFMEVSRRFHSAIARLCGNTTLALVAGALEELWVDQALLWAQGGARDRAVPAQQGLRMALKSHQQMTAAIAAGDVARVRRLGGAHMDLTRTYWLSEREAPPIDVTRRPSGFRL